MGIWMSWWCRASATCCWIYVLCNRLTTAFFSFFFEKCMPVYAVTERLPRSRCTLVLNFSCCYHFFLMAAAPFLTFYFFLLFAFLRITKQTISTSHAYAHTQKRAFRGHKDRMTF